MQLPASSVKHSSDWVLQLINIVFLLLLFFLVNGTIASQQQTAIEPPKSILVTAGNPPGDAVYIAADGEMNYRGNVVSIQRIAAILRQEMEAPDNGQAMLPAIKVVADRRLKAVALIDRLREFRRSGFGDISLITIRDEAK
jgi:biopolymer transport protein ExbD